MINDEISVSAQNLYVFIRDAFMKVNVKKDVAEYVAEGLVQTSLRGVDSHGIRLFPHYVEGVKKGRINSDPDYKFKETSSSTGLFDADHTFGHASGIEAAKKAVELAKNAGTGNVAVYNSSHFGAAAYYGLEIAKHDMIGMSFTNTDALVKTHAGKRAFLGNNPICVVIPMEGEEPFCLDMATSVITFNKVRQLKDNNLLAPSNTGADSEGIETTDPHKISMLLPVGSYKGYGLSMIVEIFCSLLTGMPYGPHIPKMFEAPMSEKRYLGHFISAVRIDCFQNVKQFKKRLYDMVNEIRNEPRLDSNVPIQVPGDPEKKMAQIRNENGIPITKDMFNTFSSIAEDFNIKFV